MSLRKTVAARTSFGAAGRDEPRGRRRLRRASSGRRPRPRQPLAPRDRLGLFFRLRASLRPCLSLKNLRVKTALRLPGGGARPGSGAQAETYPPGQNGDGACPAAAPEAAPDLLFVPLAAFDPAGHRIGYGAGFYDRTFTGLRAKKAICAVGVAYASQELPEVPHDAA